MTGLNFSASYEKKDVIVTSYSDFMAVSTIAFLCTQDDYALLPYAPSLIYAQIRAGGDNFSDFTISEAGVTVRCKIEYSGYELRPDIWSSARVLVPVYGEEPAFSIDFPMEKDSGV